MNIDCIIIINNLTMKYLVVLVLSLKITICDRIDDKVDLAMQYV